MNTAPPVPNTAPSSFVGARTALVARLQDYVELTKPRIALLALLTVLLGFALASPTGIQLSRLTHALFGILLVAAASSSLNQYLEREWDAHMARTASRPLPAGRLAPWEVLLFGIGCGGIGLLWLALAINLLTAALAGGTLVSYVLIYTPLKRRSVLCTTIGAIPGAMPPVLGWTAAGGELDGGALSLFGILYLWQFPHFLAIAWLYREQYRRAGMKMLPAPSGSRITGLASLAYSVVLIPVSLLPGRFGMAGTAYELIALLLGLYYATSAARFLVNEQSATARGLLYSSLIYLPALLIALTWDHFRLLS